MKNFIILALLSNVFSTNMFASSSEDLTIDLIGKKTEEKLSHEVLVDTKDQHFSSTDQEDKVVKKPSPQPHLTPERGCILKENFALLFMREAFAYLMASSYSDPKVMKYCGNGETVNLKHIKHRFSSRAAILFNDQILKSHYWVVVTRDGICGAVTAFDTGIENVLEASFLLAPSMQGRKQSKYLLETMFEYLPNVSWKATAHSKNVPSYKSLESAGFICQQTKYVAAYNAIRKYYSRQSNEQIENKAMIRFTYSGKYVSLADLLSE